MGLSSPIFGGAQHSKLSILSNHLCNYRIVCQIKQIDHQKIHMELFIKINFRYTQYSSQLHFCRRHFLPPKLKLLLMEEILHHLGCIKPVVNNVING